MSPDARPHGSLAETSSGVTLAMKYNEERASAALHHAREGIAPISAETRLNAALRDEAAPPRWSRRGRPPRGPEQEGGYC